MINGILGTFGGGCAGTTVSFNTSTNESDFGCLMCFVFLRGDCNTVFVLVTLGTSIALLAVVGWGDDSYDVRGDRATRVCIDLMMEVIGVV